MIKKRKKLISLLLLVSIVVTLALSTQPALAADPYVVAGRVLPANKSGDCSDWVEIARYSNSSLILRKDTIDRCGFGSTQQYNDSNARNIVNKWFKNTLGSSARLRSFTSKSNAISQLGNWANTGTGFSTPGTAASTGDDVAFLLSFAEAALFCSTQYVSSNGANYTKSSATAIANFGKLTPLPLYAQPANHWWLRTPGGAAYRICTIGLGGFNSWGLDMQNGAVNQYERESNIIYIRPALWVNSAIFDTDNVTVTYNANGGTGAPAPQTAQINTYTYLSSTRPTYSGYNFLGWAASPSATYAQYQPGDQVYITGNLTLYAVWSQAPVICTITYNANGGTGAPAPQTAQINTYTYLSSTRPTYSGYNFLGWAASPSATYAQYQPGDQVYIAGNLTLYAIWSQATVVCTISYNANGGTGAPASHTAQINTYTYLSSTRPTYSGYNFLGWATNVLAPTPQYQPGDLAFITGDLRLYALWSKAQDTRTVTGLVWPMVVEDWGLGDTFLRKHDIVVELRSTFLTPAAPGLSTKAVLINNNGYGQFTFTGVPTGTYVLYIKRPGYLTRSMMVTVTSGTAPLALAPPGTADGGVFKLWYGDCNDSRKVDNDDIALILEQMALGVNANSPYYKPSCDLNGDARVDSDDIALVLANWGKHIQLYAGSEDVIVPLY